MNIFRISLQRKAKTWSQLLKSELQIYSEKTCDNKVCVGSLKSVAAAMAGLTGVIEENTI